jgi:SAM-dependent methyltransferase
MSSSYRLEMDKWLATVDVKAKTVLDIGGSQLPIKGRTNSWEADSYLIADLPDPHVDSPKPDVVLDLNSDELVYDSFELIFCLEVFDYVWNPVQAFEHIENMLDEGGTAYVTFPFAYPTHQPIQDDALRYTEFGVQKLADYAGLKIVNIIRRRPETNLLQTYYSAERMRAAKHYDHAVTGWIVEFTK